MIRLEDVAGNRSVYLGTMDLVTDTAAPSAPDVPDLDSADDSFGEYENGSRSGTNSDDITSTTTDLTFALSSSSGSSANDQHQILLYRLPDDFTGAVTSDTVLRSIETGVSTNPFGEDNIFGAGNIFANTNLALGIRSINTYAAPGINDFDGNGAIDTTERYIDQDFKFVAFQVDDTGNVSTPSAIYTVQIDTTPPSSWFSDLEILAGDTCASGETPPHSSCNDAQTSSTEMSFGSITKSVSTDVDYYAILFRQQIENRGFITDDPDDVLFIPSTTGYAQTTTYTASGYSVGIPNVDLGHRNSVATNAKRPYGNWYQVTAFAVDIAGNKVQGTDPTQVKFLEIPIRPTDLDLQQNDDSGASNSDNITNIDDGWVISGQFGLTAGEQAANSDTTVSKIVLTVSHPESNGSVDIEIAKPAAGWGVITGSGNNRDYGFSGTFTFGAQSLPATDGTYNIAATAFNGGGERGQSSIPLVVELDREPPVESDISLFQYAHNPSGSEGTSSWHLTFVLSSLIVYISILGGVKA